LLRVLNGPEIPLHTNGSENDMLRKVSGTTRSDNGPACRDTFLRLVKTRQKLGLSFWTTSAPASVRPVITAIPSLPDLVAARYAA
jgi:hypothetical protein